MYSLFRKVDGKWYRLSKQEFPLQKARHFFQERLIAGAGELRRTKPTDKIINFVVVPAYGAIYKTKEEVLEAWQSKKDFRFVGRSTVCNVDDFKGETAMLLVNYGHGEVCISTANDCLQPS